MRSFALLGFFLLGLLANCTSSGTAGARLPEEPASIVGVVTRISAAESEWSLLVEADPGAASGSDKAYVRVDRATRVLHRRGAVVHTGTAAAIRVGDRASVWFEGPVAESYPVQAKAGVLLMETAEKTPE